MNHKQKVQLARQLRTPSEAKERKPLFLSEGWLRREQKRLEAPFERQHSPSLPHYQG